MIITTPKTQEAVAFAHEGIKTLTEATATGIRFDMAYAKDKHERLGKRIQSLEKKVANTKLLKTWKKVYGSDMNTASGDQMAHVVYDIMGYAPQHFTAKGKPSTSQEAIEALKIPEIEQFISLQKLKDARDKVLVNLMKEATYHDNDWWLHPVFGFSLPATFRGNSSNPNFQNIPNRDEKIKKIIRRAIIPRKGHQLVGIDFSKMEICGAYFYHKDPNMYKELTNPKLDMHRDMAMENLLLSKEEMGGKGCPGYSDRRHHAGKNGFIFPQFYGDSPVSCAVNIFIAIDLFELTTAQGFPIRQHLKNKGILTQEDYIEHVKKVAEKFWKVRFPKYYQWRKDWYNQYEKQGWFEMFTGFVCQGYMRKNQVINYPVQGVCFHMLLWVMNELTKLKKKEKWRSQIIGQIHDEVDGDFHEKETNHILGVANELITKKLAEHWPWITVPMKAEAKLSEVDGDWAHMKEVKL